MDFRDFTLSLYNLIGHNYWLTDSNPIALVRIVLVQNNGLAVGYNYMPVASVVFNNLYLLFVGVLA